MNAIIRKRKMNRFSERLRESIVGKKGSMDFSVLLRNVMELTSKRGGIK
jgi:hypothetical protein